MSTLEELKKIWEQKQDAGTATATYTNASFEKIIKTRVKKHTKNAFQYFWASFTLQIIVYSLLSHVIVKYGQDKPILYFAVAGVLLFIPFTIMLMRKFKKLATAKPVQEENANASLYDYVLHQQTLLYSFYNFKKWYEFFLTPLSCAIGVSLVFELYVPGGVTEHWPGAVIAFIISLISCIAAIYSENKKSFIQPIHQLQNILDEFKQKEELG
ncbi:MAG TPA: hypothetical protein VH396_22345 [Chitinophagaceae bacterium]|jgi:hypothetical protein